MSGAVFSPFGENAVLIDLPAGLPPAHVLAALHERYPHVPARAGLASVLVHSNGIVTCSELDELLSSLDLSSVSTGATITVPVRYDGTDLQPLATGLGISVEDLIAAHQRIVWNVALIGFAPGFPYLTPAEPTQDSDLFARIPRHDIPRTRVPAGAVAAAAGMSCIYPSAMPGGWQILGTTDLTLFDAHALTPSLLHVGMTVRFAAVTA